MTKVETITEWQARDKAREEFEKAKREAYASIEREAARRTRAYLSGDDW